MPATITDLGKKVKAKHPGQYDDLPDDEVGRRVKAKFPGDYDDFEDHPVTPGMERLGGVPPGPVPITEVNPMASRMTKTPGWDDPATVGSGVKMAAQFLASPITGILSAPGQIIDWAKRGGHNAGPSGGFLSEDPFGMAYGNALAATGAESGNTIKQGAQRVGKVIDRVKNDRAAQAAVIDLLPRGGKINKLRDILSPPPLTPPEPTPFTPFKTKPGVVTSWGGPAPPEYGPAGKPVLRGNWKPKPMEAPPEPAAPKAPDPFKPNPAIARKSRFGGPPPDDFGPGRPVTPTGWEAPEAPLYPTPAEAPPPQPFKKFEVNPRIKAKGKYTPDYGGSGMPSSRAPIIKRRGGMSRPPSEEAEAAGSGATEIDGVIITPAMQEALVQAELAKRGLPSKMTPMPAAAPPPGSAVLPPKTGLPPHYGGLRARVGDAGTDMAYAKDLKVASRLKSQGITPEQFEAMDMATKNAHVKAADPKFREYKEGPQKGFGRGAEEGFGHIVETLRGLYR